MAVTTASFRTKFVEFADLGRFPAWMIDYYVGLSAKMINNPARWGELEDDGRMLFVAHHAVLERKALDSVASGGVPGVSTGVINSKSVDKVSVGYDTSAGTEEGAGHWNLTIYGLRLKSLMNMMGAGPVQVGVGCSSSGSAWAGPGTWPSDSG